MAIPFLVALGLFGSSESVSVDPGGWDAGCAGGVTC